MTWTYGLSSRKIVILGWYLKVRVWIHLEGVECHTLLSDLFDIDIDIWPQF